MTSMGPSVYEMLRQCINYGVKVKDGDLTVLCKVLYFYWQRNGNHMITCDAAQGYRFLMNEGGSSTDCFGFVVSARPADPCI